MTHSHLFPTFIAIQLGLSFIARTTQAIAHDCQISTKWIYDNTRYYGVLSKFYYYNGLWRISVLIQTSVLLNDK